MKQIYHKYELWEDYINGMWRKETKEYDRDMLLPAINFIGDHVKFGRAMIRVVNEWKISCEHNLSNLNVNRRAWIGQAACCLELGLPEYLVREAWKTLTYNQRSLADKRADIAIKTWESNYKRELNKNQLYFNFYNEI